MRKAFIALLATLGVAAFAANVLAQEFSNSELMLLNAKSAKEKSAHASHSGVTFAGVDPETVWVGHVFTGATYDYGPFHIGRGPNLPLQAGLSPNNNTITPASAGNGAWQFDLYQPGENDSLQGWWPIKLPQRGTLGILNPPYQDTDRNRTWWALDHGNQLNYRSTALKGGVPRTFGVAGLWHRDNGSLSAPLGAAASPKWLPIGGSGASAWCGIRALGDGSFVDATPGIGNPFDGSIIQYNRFAGPSALNWTALPGYTEQIDQMMFRDCTPTGSGHTLAFDYVTRMSTSISADPTIVHGWFNFDPLRQPNTANDRNYISATDNAGGGSAVVPVDSFMVYVGAPVNDAACTFSDGSVGAVYDPLRRWFSEVLDITKPMFVLLHVGGEAGGFNVTTGALTPVNFSQNIDSQIATVAAASGGPVRLVFRVKTNRVGDDTDGVYNSNTAGAAILDNVSFGGTGGFSENFDAGGINNTAGTSTAFHSTGKPPYCQAHIHNLSTLVYNELCGPPNSVGRGCDIWSNVISLGDHQNAEASGGIFGGPEQEQINGIASPTINLVNGGVGVYNGMGIDEEIASRDEFNFWYDAYAGRNNVIATGSAWSFCAMAYPVKQAVANGATKTWGPFNQPGFIFFNPDPQCFFDIEELYSQGCLAWDATASVSPTHPDSVIVFIGSQNQCFRFGVQAGCGSTLGFYLDQMAMGFNNTGLAASARSGGTNAVGSASISIWQLFNDTFPANATTGLPGTTAFDTCGAHVKTGLGLAPQTGVNRPTVPGDSSCVIASGAGMRLDLVFRIKPGPGNYVTAGTPASGLRKVPNSATAVVSGDNSFWGQYEASNGDRGSANTHAGAPGGWDINCWNSARMDTVERNFFPTRSNVVVLTPSNYMTTYFETDPHGGQFGGGPGVPGPLAISRSTCFLINPAGANASTNITCGNGTYPPAWVTGPGTGYGGATTTFEYTKILPDGIFTPGTHVEYFYRKEEISSGATFLGPDTTHVFPQNFESSTDGHRWQEFTVLPDRWKSTTYSGPGGLCMLFVDNNDRRGNERIWVSVADSIGATTPAKYGAHNGWHAVGGVDQSITGDTNLNDPLQNRRPDGSVGYRSDHGGSAGTIWDMYGIKASESLTTRAGGLGARLSAPGFGYLVGHESTIGPTPEMLQTYYDVMLWVTGDLNSGIMGPYTNQSTNDVLQVEDFMLSGTTLRPRAVWVIGNGFAEGEGSGDHVLLVTNFFGMSYRGSYGVLSGTQLVDCVDLIPTSPVSTTDIYGGNNVCDHSNDVVNRNTDPSLAASAYQFYQALGGGAPYIEGLRTDLTASKHYKTAWDGVEIEHVYSRFCLGSFGRLTYIRNVLVNVIGTLCPLAGSPVGIGQDGHGLSGRDFLQLASANPYRNGTAKFSFGIARSGKVEVGIYDVAGRQVRVLANQVFQPGNYELTWDGLDAGGNAVSRGVYFYRLKSPNFTSANKMIVLK